jgi:hypothetical protein
MSINLDIAPPAVHDYEKQRGGGFNMPPGTVSGSYFDRVRQSLQRFNDLSLLQRRTLNHILICLVLLVVNNTIASYAVATGYRGRGLVSTFGILSAIPTLGVILVVGRYLSKESDEFIRLLVVQSLLWAAAVIVVMATIQGVLGEWSIEWRLIPNETATMNFDLFIATSLIALAFQLRRNR